MSDLLKRKEHIKDKLDENPKSITKKGKYIYSDLDLFYQNAFKYMSLIKQKKIYPQSHKLQLCWGQDTVFCFLID